MKVFFLIKSDKTPSSRIRVKNLVPVLEKLGIEAEVEAIPTSFIGKLKTFKKASLCPIVVLQKRLLNVLDFYILRHYAKFLIYDFDDAVYLKNASPSADRHDYESSTRQKKFVRTVLNSDMIIAANTILANHVRELDASKPLSVIASSVDAYDVPFRTDYGFAGKPVIGWIGTKSTLRYIEYISPALLSLKKRHDFILHIIADGSIEIPGLEIKYTKWEESAQAEMIASFDIGIMPLSFDPFSEGKAAYKLLQYMAAGLPSVCSSVGMNNYVAGNNEYALKAATVEEFEVQLEKLLADRRLRETLGGRARELVQEKYSISAVASRLAEILKSI